MFVAATRKNCLSTPLRCYISATFWRTQTTKPAKAQLEESDSFNDLAISEVSPSQVREFEDMPGPKRGVMSFVEFYRKSESLTKGYKLSEALFAKYGPVYKENYGGETQVHISDPDDFETVLRAEGKYPRRLLMQVWLEHRVRRNYFHGIVQLNGEEWHRIRRNVAPKMMRPKVVEENLDNFNLVAEDAMARFVKLKEACGPADHIPDLEGELMKFTLESIGTMAFDTRLGLYSDPPSPEGLKFIAAVHDFFDLSQKLLLSIPSNLMRPYMDTPALKKFFTAADEILDIGEVFVNRKIKELEEMSNKGIESPGKVVPLLTYLLTKEELSLEEVNGTAIDVVTGGVDTTSNALLWMLYHLGRLPHIQEKLHEEVDRVVGKEKHITPDKIANLSYLKACLKESMRVTPTVTLNSRILEQDVVLSGYRVPANTHVLLEMYSAGNSEKYFKNASEFKPERWLRENKGQNHAFSSVPFGHGVRMCIGRRIAEIEIYVLICKLLQEFRIEYTGEPLEILQKMVSCPDKPVKVKFVDRG
ncbi:PREDICTED: cytochrome P450 27C1-like [Acropora digitifera]|uniref:cytochrome P450 27C1-like n=1 Tax=Acropora digitifera TaxID=70779 RepID=UPI00077A0943|nr:PREDICTED: cytochrome P450 27C1-like [Acropora digitifera]